jgi:hypothetical protein
MTFDMGNNTNKLILLVVAAVALLLALNIYQKQLGKNVAIVLAVVTIVVVVVVGVSLMTQNGSANNNARNNAPINNVVEGFYGDEDEEAYTRSAQNNFENSGLAEDKINKGGNVGVAAMGFNMPGNERNNGGPGAPGASVIQGVDDAATPIPPIPTTTGDNFTGSRKRREHFEGNNNATTAAANNNAGTTAAGNNNNNPVDSGVMKCTDLLPGDTTSTWAQVSPAGIGSLCDKNLLNAGHHVGVNTKGTSLRNANRGLRSEPPCPQVNVSPWLQTTIAPDLLRRPLE